MEYVQLFSKGRLNDLAGSLAGFLGKASQATAQRLQSWDADDLLNTPVDDVVEQLVELGSVECPDLRVDDAFMLPATEVDQQYRDWGEQRTRRVTRLVLVVPFEGHKDIFNLRPDQFTTMPPQVLRLQGHEIHLAIDNPSNDAAAINAAFHKQIANIEKYLGWSRRQIDLHNQGLRNELPGMVARRREQLLATRNLQAEIGFLYAAGRTPTHTQLRSVGKACVRGHTAQRARGQHSSRSLQCRMRTTSPHFGCSVTSGTRWSAPHLSPPSSTGRNPRHAARRPQRTV